MALCCVCGAARAAPRGKILAYDAKSLAPNSLKMLKAKSTLSISYVAKALKAPDPSISPTIPAWSRPMGSVGLSEDGTDGLVLALSSRARSRIIFERL